MKYFTGSLLLLLLASQNHLHAETAKSEGKPKIAKILQGKASYYYGKWIGRKTANGEIYHRHDVTAAHKTLPFNTKVRVTNLRNGKSVVVRINNRGPYIKGRIIDLSLAAAQQIGMTKAGVVPVKAEVFAN
jgi:rare lipoprotein A